MLQRKVHKSHSSDISYWIMLFFLIFSKIFLPPLFWLLCHYFFEECLILKCFLIEMLRIRPSQKPLIFRNYSWWILPGKDYNLLGQSSWRDTFLIVQACLDVPKRLEILVVHEGFIMFFSRLKLNKYYP